MTEKSLWHKVGRSVFSDYRINWIVAGTEPPELPLAPGDEFRELDPGLLEQLGQSRTRRVAMSVEYTRGGLEGFAIVHDGAPLCVAHVARPKHYHCSNIWPIRADEVAILDLATEDTARGQGLAPRIIASIMRRYAEEGTGRVISFMWWSNTPSVRAFAKVGMRRIGLSIEIRFARQWWRWHLKFPHRRAPRATSSPEA